MLVNAFCRDCPCAAHVALMNDMRLGGQICRNCDAFYLACDEIRRLWATCPLNGNAEAD